MPPCVQAIARQSLLAENVHTIWLTGSITTNPVSLPMMTRPAVCWRGRHGLPMGRFLYGASPALSKSATSPCRVRIETDGLFGIGATHIAWMGFSAHAIEKAKPFLSDTGYRSFLGVGGALVSGFTPDTFAAAIIAAYVDRELKGRLRKIVPLRRHGNTGPISLAGRAATRVIE